MSAQQRNFENPDLPPEYSQARNGNPAGGSRGSKQKILQLREELNSTKRLEEARLEKLKVLRESYEISRHRSNELFQPNEQHSLYMKIHEQRASKIYAALSSLLFASVCSSKVDELEKFVRKSAVQIPSSVFDLEEWGRIMDIARECRGNDTQALKIQTSNLKRNLRLTFSVLAKPLENSRAEVRLLRLDVANQLQAYQNDINQLMGMVMYVTNELKDRCSTDETGSRLEQLSKENKALVETVNRLTKEQSTSAQQDSGPKRDEKEVQQIIQTHQVQSEAAQRTIKQLQEALEQERGARSAAENLLQQQQQQQQQEVSAGAEAQGQSQHTQIQQQAQQEQVESMRKLELAEKQIADLTEALDKERTKAVAAETAAYSIEAASYKVGEALKRGNSKKLQGELEEATQQLQLVQEEVKAKDDELAELRKQLDDQVRLNQEKQQEREQQRVGAANAAASAAADESKMESISEQLKDTRRENAELLKKLATMQADLKKTHEECDAAQAAAEAAATAATAANAASDSVGAAMEELAAAERRIAQLEEDVVKKEADVQGLLAQLSEITAAASIARVQTAAEVGADVGTSDAADSPVLNPDTVASLYAAGEQWYLQNKSLSAQLQQAANAVTTLKAALEQHEVSHRSLLDKATVAGGGEYLAGESTVSGGGESAALNGAQDAPETGEDVAGASPRSSARSQTAQAMVEGAVKEGLSIAHHRLSPETVPPATRDPVVSTADNADGGGSGAGATAALKELTGAAKAGLTASEILSKQIRDLQSQLLSYCDDAAATAPHGTSKGRDISADEYKAIVARAEAEANTYAAQAAADRHAAVQATSSNSAGSTAAAVAAAVATARLEENRAAQVKLDAAKDEHALALEAQKKQADADLSNANAEVQCLKEALQKAEEELSAAQIELKEAQGQTDGQAADVAALNAQLEAASQRQADNDAVLKAAQEEAESLRDKVKALEKEHHNKDETIIALEKSVATAAVTATAATASAAASTPSAESKTEYPVSPLRVEQAASMDTSDVDVNGEADPTIRIRPPSANRRTIAATSPLGLQRVGTDRQAAPSVRPSEDTATEKKSSEPPPSPLPRARASFIEFGEQGGSGKVSGKTSAASATAAAAASIDEDDPQAGGKGATKDESQAASATTTPTAGAGAGDLAVYEQSQDTVVLLQTQMRSFLAKAKVRKIRTEKAAKEQGVLVAYKGTIQGETGWYTSNGQLFYFCLDRGEYVLLCGPISEEIYSLAVEELEQDPRLKEQIQQLLSARSARSARSGPRSARSTRSSARSAGPSSPGGGGGRAGSDTAGDDGDDDNRDDDDDNNNAIGSDLHLDRLGLHATRIQIETLIDDLRNRDELMERLHEELASYKKRTEEMMDTHVDAADKEVQRLREQLQEYKDTIKLLEKERGKLSATAAAAVTKMEEKAAALSPEQEEAFQKLSGAMRGYLGRNRVKKIQNFKQARETGQLIPLKNTKSGESGWYAAPDNSVYYFVLKDGHWIHSVGPITQEEFDVCKVNLKQKQRSHAEGVLTHVSGMKLVPLQDPLLEANAELYMENHTDKLYVALLLDNVVPVPEKDSSGANPSLEDAKRATP